jgi:hypothetical protein
MTFLLKRETSTLFLKGASLSAQYETPFRVAAMINGSEKSGLESKHSWRIVKKLRQDEAVGGGYFGVNWLCRQPIWALTSALRWVYFLIGNYPDRKESRRQEPESSKTRFK